MRIALLLITCLASMMLLAQDLPKVQIPDLPKQGRSAQDFIPAGWKLEAQEIGDLDGDGLPDLLMVLRQNNPQNVLSNNCLPGEDPIDSNPRILAVAFRDKVVTGYGLVLQNATLIPRHKTSAMDDPFDGITLSGRTFHVKLSIRPNGNMWDSTEDTFTFRYQDGCFRLIGYDSHGTQHGSGATTDRRINYLTHYMITTLGNQASVRDKTQRSRPSNTKVICLEGIGNGLEFNPE